MEEERVAEVDLQELERALADGALLLDVRERGEYAEGHVPQAQLLPLSVLPRRVREVPRDRPVYVICRSGRRSADAVQLLRRAGVDARNVPGGTAAWTASGRPSRTGSPRS